MSRIFFVLVVLDPTNSFSQRLPYDLFETNYERAPFIITGDGQTRQEILEYKNAASQSISGSRRGRDENVKTFDTNSNGKPSQISHYVNSFEGYSQNWRQRPLKMYNGHTRSQNILFSDCNATSNTIFIREPAWNTFKAPDYLPPPHETRTVVTKHPHSTINRMTKKPFYTWTETRTIDNTMTTKPYYSYIPREKHNITTKGPYYIPVTKPSTYHATRTNNNDTKMDEYDPARAMHVPFEDETFMVIPVSKTEKPRGSTTGIEGEVNVVLKQTTLEMKRPDDRINSQRGDVPDDYEDLTTKSGEPAPAIAIPVPTEPEEETPIATKTTTTVASTTTGKSTTSILSNTTNIIRTMTTLENNRHLTEESFTTPTYKKQSTTPIPFKGIEYLPPETTMMETVPVTTPPTGSTNIPASPAPALAMNVPTVPEDVPSIQSLPSTTPPATTFTSSTIVMLTTNKNHHVVEVNSSATTLINKMQTTTMIPFKGLEYLSPKATTRIPSVVTASSAVGPAMAMDVPPEPEDLPTSSSTSTTLTDSFRTAAVSTSTSSVSETSPFKAPEYLPPTTEPSPSPAIAMKVPSEPECDPDSDNPKIDTRSLINDPCVQTTPKLSTASLFKGPEYLPPLLKSLKTRVERSLNKTLSLRDLDGTPRPVWYAGVYRKTTEPPYPICGGSIVREDVVISAAHCFWDDKDGLQSPGLFAVAARKIYKRYNHPMDKRAQKSDVVSIKVPPRFLGAKTSFQDDIAVLKLETPFKFTPSVSGLRPICVDFDVEFDREQMKGGHMGTVAGWGYTDASGTGTRVLLWLELPYVDIEKCILNSETSFLKYITCDKVCAGENDTGKALCRGDSGGGLAFWQGTPARGTPYLRGVASTAPSRRNAECNVFAYGSFTHVRAHRTFLRDHVPDIEECRFWE